MNIFITHGIGEGLTKLAAFDAALFDAGIANYNLIKLTSIIPPESKIIVGKLKWNKIEWGNKLYVVISSWVEEQFGEAVYVGLGWENEIKRGGIFVEHRGRTKKEVIDIIKKSLFSIKKYRLTKGKIEKKIVGIKCVDKPVCAIVAAVYKSEGWE